MKKLFLFSGIIFFFVSYAVAQDVVVIPLLGDEATGNATRNDVLRDKTFSNSNNTGLTGIRPPATVAKTGQVVSYRTGDDGYYEMGEWVPYPSPYPRFTVGTNVVKHNLTGLIWQKSANNGFLYWNEAIDYCEILNILELAGQFSITYDDWRLPNIKELQSLIDYGYSYPPLSNASGSGQWSEGNPFNQVLNGIYWSSTTDDFNNDDAWSVSFGSGLVYKFDKDTEGERCFVWCVHSGH